MFAGRLGARPSQRLRHVQARRLGQGDPEVRAARMSRPGRRRGSAGRGGDGRRHRQVLLLGPKRVTRCAKTAVS